MLPCWSTHLVNGGWWPLAAHGPQCSILETTLITSQSVEPWGFARPAAAQHVVTGRHLWSAARSARCTPRRGLTAGCCLQG